MNNNKRKKKKDQTSELEGVIFEVIEKSLEAALSTVFDEMQKDWEKPINIRL